VSGQDNIQAWLTERKIEDVEAFVPDMAGAARGKLIPIAARAVGD
jgi:glutamine synthetase